MTDSLQEKMAEALCKQDSKDIPFRFVTKGEVYVPSSKQQWRFIISKYKNDPFMMARLLKQVNITI